MWQSRPGGPLDLIQTFTLPSCKVIVGFGLGFVLGGWEHMWKPAKHWHLHHSPARSLELSGQPVSLEQHYRFLFCFHPQNHVYSSLWKLNLFLCLSHHTYCWVIYLFKVVEGNPNFDVINWMDREMVLTDHSENTVFRKHCSMWHGSGTVFIYCFNDSPVPLLFLIISTASLIGGLAVFWLVG